MPDEPPMVSYPIADVLREISTKIDRLFDMLSGKADKAELASLEAKVTGHDEQIKALLVANQMAANERKDRIAWRQWVVPVLISIVSAIATALTVVFH